MAHHFKLYVLFWYDEEYSVPDYLEHVKTVDRGHSKTKVFKSKKYDLLRDMMDDYNAIQIPKVDATPTFYKNDERLPPNVYKHYIKI